MKTLKLAAIFSLALSFVLISYESAANNSSSIKQVSDFEIAILVNGQERHCKIDQRISILKQSTDKSAVIISGTSYVTTEELIRCNNETAIHARAAAPHASFLSDISLSSGIYASMVPISVNPMSFVAVVAKIGSDKNIVKLPGFYRLSAQSSELNSEASSNMSPVFSVDAHYVALDARSCNASGDIEVIDIRLSKSVRLNRDLCEKLFDFGQP